MINILFISSSLEKNGTEEFMMNVLRGLDRKSYHADFAFGYFQKVKPKTLKKLKAMGLLFIVYHNAGRGSFITELY